NWLTNSLTIVQSQKLGFLASLLPSVREDTVAMFAPPILLAFVSIVRVAFAPGIDPTTVPQSTRGSWSNFAMCDRKCKIATDRPLQSTGVSNRQHPVP